MMTTKEKNLDLHTTAVREIGSIVNSIAGEPEIVDMSTNEITVGRWSQEKFKRIFTRIVASASVVREFKNRMFVSVLVSPDVSVALQSISSSGDVSDRDFVVEMLDSSIDGSTDAIMVLNNFVIVYVDIFATESYSCVFATDHSDLANVSILEEFPNLIVPSEQLVVKNVYVGLNKYFGNAFPNIPA